MQAKIGLKYFNSPSPRWAMVTKWLSLVLIPTLQSQLPSMPISDSTKYWVGFSTTIGLLILAFTLEMLGYPVDIPSPSAVIEDEKNINEGQKSLTENK